ncbi:putative mitochondrial protein [Trifolium repens]|nr:putative mitochondrial protein [Trifolium repens]
MADSNDFQRPSIPKFDRHYDHWALVMENLLRSKELWDLTETGVMVAPANATVEQQQSVAASQLKDLKVKNYLYQSIDRTILETILTRTTAKDIWDSMRSKYQGSTKVKRAQLQALRREFEILGMKDTETIDEYFARTLAIANRMSANGENMQQVQIVEKILRSLIPKYNYVVCSIEESNDVTTLSVDELQSSLLVQEQRLKAQNAREEEQALKITHGGRGEGSRGRGRGSRGRGRGRLNREDVECYKCHKKGHFRNECPTWEENDVNYVETGEVLLMAQHNSNTSAKDEVWFLDSGCSNHMIGNKEWLFNFDDSVREFVKLGDDSRMEIKGKGNIKLCINGLIQVITEVYYIPGLKNNLLSIGQLQEKGLSIHFEDNQCVVHHKERGVVLMSTKMSSNRMFIIYAPVIMPQCFKITQMDINELWHNRYAHLSFKGLNTLVKKDMVHGLPKLQEKDEKCTGCLKGKQHREAIPKEAQWRATKVLELVHSDICGPITPQSNGGCRYFMTFTDDFSRKTWIHLLVDKASAFTEFKKFKTMVENESNCKMMCLRTDRGGEFTSNEFNEYCCSNGIKRQLTTAYTPQQNGVSERKNRTLLNMVRSMLSGRNVPKSFWPEALKWATYVLNRSPTLSVKNMTPEEAWTGRKPTVHHFRVFGCLAHVHIHDVHRKKLDDKSIPCFLLGISEESKGYKLYDPSAKKVIVSKDVIFEESKGWKWKNDKAKPLDDPISISSSHEQDDEQGTDIEDMEVQNETGNTNVHNDSDSNSQASEDTITYSSDEMTPRVSRRPRYLDDYVTGDESDNDDALQNLAMFSNNNDPVTYDEAAKSEVWKKAMDQEIESIEKNNTWELVTLPEGAKTVGVKWIYKTKLNEKGEVEKHKARLVAKGYSQQHGVDYNEVFAPVARWDTIRTILSLAASSEWKVYQLDVKSAFLHGELTENVYVEQPLGYKKVENKVYKLRKALYGLKQAPRAWYSKIEAYFAKENFIKCPHEHTLFVKKDGEKVLIVSLYVDDLIFTGNDSKMFQSFKESMKNVFDMTDLGRMRYFLGVEVNQGSHGIFICQQKYIKDILSRFGMEMCNVVCSPIVPGNKLSKDSNGKCVDATYYKQIVGSLMYLLATRPDLAYSVCLIARFMERPTEDHLVAAKRILRYLKGTANLGILYERGVKQALQGWTDSDYAGDVEDRKSTSGYVYTYGSSAISWSSKKQPIVTLSTTEAEFVAAASCACQGLWLKRILYQLGEDQGKGIVIFCDNSSSIKLSKNPIMHGRCKHMDVRYFFLRDLVKDEVFELKHCKTQDQIADVMTKPLKLESFCKFRKLLGVCSLQPEA